MAAMYVKLNKYCRGINFIGKIYYPSVCCGMLEYISVSHCVILIACGTETLPAAIAESMHSCMLPTYYIVEHMNS
jgi:hypothetical protein